MRAIHRFRAWCRAIDATIDSAEKRGERHYPPPLVTTAMAVILVALGLATGLVFSQRSVTFAAGWFIACACFAVAIALGGPAQYRKWLLSQRRLNGQCPHCGFDLRHSPHHCPECGSPVADADRKHMTVTFTATEAGAVCEATFAKIWLASANPRHMLTLQRSTDTQIYITFDLEPHTTSGRILSCTLHADTLHLHVTGYFNNRYEQFEIFLADAPGQRDSLVAALRNILHGTYAKVSIQ